MASLYCESCGEQKTSLLASHFEGEATIRTRGVISKKASTENSLLCDSCNKPLKEGDVSFLLEFFPSEGPRATDYWKDYFDIKKGLTGIRTSKNGPRAVFTFEYTILSDVEFEEFFRSWGAVSIEKVNDDLYVIVSESDFALCSLRSYDSADIFSLFVMMVRDSSYEEFLDEVCDHDDALPFADIKAATERACALLPVE